MSVDPKQRIELQVQKGIREAEDELVCWIEEALRSTNYPKTGQKKLEEAQFRNLLRVSETTTSSEVIKNFLRYQVGRDDKWGCGEGSLAERIITDIDDRLKSKAREIEQKAGSSDEKAIHIELIRRYLGYGSRRLVYLNKKENKLKNN
ncbi:hypothetical protein PMG71_23310 [Roseofilum sp. BLCC_M154]|uniref:Uncharacterized protein n=1 Tax=Roseofilum acuticapitatum BLCC-M154 TaxID=3022444 RepID=A0ABT7AZL6_9CYAN|nr:hypothetical protein [Roseofilum acuticapitatum]MDJ1172362.1 hypothetical protein [Roseofilum acuticapitatum BLCC-M154]